MSSKMSDDELNVILELFPDSADPVGDAAREGLIGWAKVQSGRLMIHSRTNPAIDNPRARMKGRDASGPGRFGRDPADPAWRE